VTQRDEDEEAFHWAGDDVGGREGARLPSEQVQDAAAGIPTAEPVETPRSAPLQSALTFLFGAGYLALTVGWILGTQYTSAGTTQLLPQVLWQFGEFTAIIAAPLWFGAVVLLTRGGRLAHRIGWLALGLGALLPWPVLPLLVVS
jgi:hypothetical protein